MGQLWERQAPAPLYYGPSPDLVFRVWRLHSDFIHIKQTCFKTVSYLRGSCMPNDTALEMPFWVLPRCAR